MEEKGNKKKWNKLNNDSKIPKNEKKSIFQTRKERRQIMNKTADKKGRESKDKTNDMLTSWYFAI